MSKKWTMPDGKTRAASEGPWVSLKDCRAFREWLTSKGVEWRKHPGLMSEGYQVRHQGHWMGLLWNKGFKRYTADRRLSLIVQSFAAEKAESDQRDPIWDAMKDHSKAKFDSDRASFMAQAKQRDDGGWTKHTEYHWSRMVDGQRLDYWPSRKKYRWKGKVVRGDVMRVVHRSHAAIAKATEGSS